MHTTSIRVSTPLHWSRARRICQTLSDLQADIWGADPVGSWKSGGRVRRQRHVGRRVDGHVKMTDLTIGERHRAYICKHGPTLQNGVR